MRNLLVQHTVAVPRWDRLCLVVKRHSDAGLIRAARSLHRSPFTACLLRFPALGAAEPQVRHPGIGRAAHSRAWTVVEAVADAAEEGATPVNVFRRSLAWVETALRAFGIDQHALARRQRIGVGKIPVVAPLPDVAGHVIQA